MPVSQNMEEWRKVEEFPNYSVSNLGNVRNDETGLIKAQGQNNSGYNLIYLVENKIQKTRTVHRLVAKAFCETTEECNEVDHIDGNKTNNNALNLRWVTRSQNLYNRKKSKPSQSQFVGIGFDKRVNKWKARFKVDGIDKSLGYYETEEEAYAARRQAIIDNQLQEFVPDFENYDGPTDFKKLSHSESCRKRKKRDGCSSAYMGVHLEKNKWKASLRINKKKKHLGQFDTEEEAHTAWRQAVIDHNLQEFYPQYF